MPEGLVLTEWDKSLGPEIKVKFPNNFLISKNEINRLLLAHSVNSDLKAETIELRISSNNRIFISYCAKDIVPKIGYAMIVLILTFDEIEEISHYRTIIEERGKKIFELGGINRNKLIKSLVNEVFDKKEYQKILIIGPTAVGKSSIRKFFFEAIPSEVLIDEPLEPTFGLSHFNYNWLDVQLGIADLAGQEIDQYIFGYNDHEINIFNSVDFILYIFDPSSWISDSSIILNHIKKIQEIQKKYENSKLVIFCHKFDLIKEVDRNVFQHKILENFPKKMHFSIFFTSIISGSSYLLIKAMQIIIGSFSKRSKLIEEQLFHSIKSLSSTSIIILKKNKIILTVSTQDFPIINYSKLRTTLLASMNFFEDFGGNLNYIHMKNSNLNILYSHVEYYLDHIQIILMSQKLTMNELEILNKSIQTTFSTIIV